MYGHTTTAMKKLSTPPPLSTPWSKYRLLSTKQGNTLLIAVEDNETVMKAGAGALLGGGKNADRFVTVSSYLEALGVVAAHKAGVNPACLTTDMPAIKKMLPLEAAREGGDGVAPTCYQELSASVV